jgi:mRNA interferase RelE/StbE
MEVILSAPAKKDLRKLFRDIRSLVDHELKKIREEYAHIEKMALPPPRWKVRVGEYRIILTLDKKTSTATVLKVKHRKDVYR